MTATNFRDEVRTLLHDRLLDAAQEMTVKSGWTRVTMAGIAQVAGVSRQTVYNEFGTKPELADELVMRELGRFIDLVRLRFRAENEVILSIRAACEGALTMAQTNPLLKAALDSVSGGENELLPLLTTQSQELINVASVAVSELVVEQYGDIALTSEQLDTAAAAIVRLVLSHVMRPSKSPAEVAADIAWFAGSIVNQ